MSNSIAILLALSLLATAIWGDSPSMIEQTDMTIAPSSNPNSDVGFFDNRGWLTGGYNDCSWYYDWQWRQYRQNCVWRRRGLFLHFLIPLIRLSSPPREWSTMILLALLFLVRCNSATVDEEAMASLARSLVSSDLFLSHLRSSLVNKSIDPCHNFYRRVCPVDMPGIETINYKIHQHIIKVMNDSIVRELFKPSEKGLILEKLRSTAVSDQTNYADFDDIKTALGKIDSASLVPLAQFIHTDYMLYAPIFTEWLIPKWKEMARLLDRTVYKVLDAKIKANDTATVNFLIMMTSLGIRSFMKAYTLAENAMDSGNYLVKMHNNFENIMRSDPMMMRVLQSLGSNHTRALERMDSVLDDVLEEYHQSYTNGSWSHIEDRFGYSRSHIYTTYLKNLSFAIFYTNRYSISPEKKTSLLHRFENLFVEKFHQLTALSHMARLRLIISRNWAVDQIEQENFGTMIPLKSTTNPFDAFAVPKSGYTPHFILINPLSAMQTPHVYSAAISTLIGSVGFTFAHEMYHQTQFVMRNLIEDKREHDNGIKCVENYMNNVCDRFTEATCSSVHTEKEDTADIFGSQIAYRVLQKQLGADVDKIAVADLQLTHRELFFNTLALFFCTPDNAAQWHYESKDTHNGGLYRTNSMLSNLPAFKETYGCYEDDLMSIPEKLQCPLFSQHLA